LDQVVDAKPDGIPVAHLSSLLRGTVDPVALLDCTSGVPVLSRARRRALELLGVSDRATGHPVAPLLPRSAAAIWTRHEEACVQQGRPTRVELPMPEGFLRVDFCPIGEGQTEYVVVTVHPPIRPPGQGPVDRTLELLVRHSPAGTAMLDEHLVVLRANPALGALFGIPADALAGQSLRQLLDPDGAATLDAVVPGAVAEPGMPLRTGIRIGGVEHLLEVCCVGTRPQELVVSLRAAVSVDDHLAAMSDELTGLDTRSTFTARLERLVAAATPDHRASLFLIDLDNFKLVNDALGHTVGDETLRIIAGRLADVAVGGLVSRFGSDEFALAHVGPPFDVVQFGAALRDVFETPVPVAGREVRVTASIGAVTGAGEQADALLRKADLAIYEAKHLGKDRLAVYDASLEAAAIERVEIARELRGAAERGELVVFYQPIVDVITQRPIGSEALVRWQHPTRGMIPPVKFIPIAEENGLIGEIGNWVLQEAVRQTAEWNQQGLSRRSLSISVNLSGHQLGDPALVRMVEAALARFGLDPQKLTLEITETVMMSDAAATVTKLDQLRRLGTRMAIDDFGTGYSSLSYLKRLPATTIKIDRAFIDGLGSVQEDTALVTGIIGLANAVDLAVVAEGVENERQLRELRRLGCEYSQGYFHARPMPAAEFATWVTGTGADSRTDDGVSIL
jgi:diguanylate cyclase (GGDEF)-like protein